MKFSVFISMHIKRNIYKARQNVNVQSFYSLKSIRKILIYIRYVTGVNTYLHINI